MTKKLRHSRRRGLDPNAELTIHRKGLSLKLGILQLVFGIISVIFGTALIPAYAWGHEAAMGIWSGVIFIVAGSMVIVANKKRRLRHIVYCSAGCLFSIILGFVVFIFHAVAVHYNRPRYEYYWEAWELTPSDPRLQFWNLNYSCVLAMNIILMFNGLIQLGCGFQQFYLCSMTISQYEKFLEKAESNRGQVNQAAQAETPPPSKQTHRCPADRTKPKPNIHTISSEV
jgi:hypothetical protein